MAILESSFIIFGLQPYYNNFSKRLVKTSKLYFYDTGLACYLLEIDTPEAIQNHFMRGALFENFVILEMIKHRWNQGQDHRLYFWRDHKGAEIDVIFEEQGKHIAVEIKAGMTITQDYFKNFRYLEMADTIPYVVYMGEQTQQRKDAHVIGWEEIEKVMHSKN